MAVFVGAVSLAARSEALDDANQLLAQSKWAEASAAFRQLLRDQPGNGAVWMGLGEAQLQQKRLAEARAAFEKALGVPFRPVVNQVNLARVAAAGGDKGRVYEIFRALVTAGNGGRARPIIAGAPEFEKLAADPTFVRYLKEEMAPCKDTPYRQFDFWIGDWDVQDPAGKPAGKNLVTREQEGCLLIEHWTSAEGVQTGTSFNYYDVRDRKWHQLYLDNSGNAGAFPAMAGAFEGGRMVLLTEPKDGPVSRWIWTELAPGRVRQMAEQTSDGGKTWQVTWDSIYVRAAAPKG